MAHLTSDERGLRIGRYEILEAIGSGSTATVYRAHDRDLGRQVSLKLLHATSSDSSAQAAARGRLLGEAQALARLSHQNVVAAYDVGTHEGALFITMEFIEGTSLRDWLAQPRHRAEVLRVLIAAGRGLVAAHESGVLHRDFKPANVMVASDGRVLVVDFGLARAATGAASGPATRDVEAPPSPGSQAQPRSMAQGSSSTLTRTAGVVGTPGFVPPEQWLGGTIDHSSDQFSYAVTAFVALTGKKPYPDVVEATELPLLSRARTAWPRSVPRTLRRIVDRGLSLRPEHRYPSVAAMVNALERFASPWKWRSWQRALAGAFAASVALPGALPKPAASRALCNVDDTALIGVWDATERNRVEQAFLATQNNNAAEAFALVSQRLDAFRSQWLALRRDSCEATLRTGEQPERVMVLRATCLDRALAGTKALVGALGKVDAAAMNRVAEASPASLTGCSDAAVLLGSADQLPPDPQLRAVIDDVEVGLAVNQGLLAAARRPEAIERAQQLVGLAGTTSHLPTMARATAQLGTAMQAAATTSEQRAAAEATLKESMHLAALVGEEQLLARTASTIFYNTAYVQTRVQEGEAMLPAVEALVRQAGNPPIPRIQVSIGQSTLFIRRNKFEAAVAVLEDAIRLSRENTGSEFERFASSASAELGFVYAYLGKFAEAEAMGQRGLEGMRRRFGSHHPRILNSFANFATLQAKAGHLDHALETIAEYRALAATMPATEPALKYVPLSESRVWRNAGHCERAVPLQREALVKFSAADGPDHPLTTTVMLELGNCLAETHNVREAISFLERVLDNTRKSRDAGIPDAAFALAKALWRVPAEQRRARALAEEAGSLWRADEATASATEAEQWLAAHPL